VKGRNEFGYPKVTRREWKMLTALADSLAGQMATMKGGTTKSRPAQEDSDDESGTDDDVEDDTSETNTDTDGE
jgi:hypothetical protein